MVSPINQRNTPMTALPILHHIPAADVISQAKARLILTQPFFGSLACSLDFEENDTLNPPTMATDGEKVYYHPEFVLSHTADENLFVVCHEIMHVALVHMFRMRTRDMMLANIAADYAINEILCVEGIGSFPKGGLRDTAIYTEGGGTMEGIYSLLLQKFPPQSGGGGSGEGGEGKGSPGKGLPELMDRLLEPSKGMSDSEIAAKEAEVKLKVAGAMQAAEMRGTLPGSLKRLLKDALDVKTPWQNVLRRFFTERSDEFRSWARPNRRFASQGIYLPSPDGVRMGIAFVGTDASGSISQKVFDIFAAEMNKVVADTKPKKVVVGVFDTRVTDEIEFDPSEGDRIILTAKAGGGTDFAPSMEWCQSREEDPACLIMLTDGHCSSFGNQPSCPVLWAVLGDSGNKKFDPPFGEVIWIEG
jgi:predicted metal-dependent peptidase